MSSGYIFGYGAVIPIEDFIKIVPGAFVRNDYVADGAPILVANLDMLKDLTKQSGIKFVWESDTIVFVTVRSAIRSSCEAEDGKYIKSDIEQIGKEAQILAPWLTQHFPQCPIGYILYKYTYKV